MRVHVWGFFDVFYASAGELDLESESLWRRRRMPTQIGGQGFDLKVVNLPESMYERLGGGSAGSWLSHDGRIQPDHPDEVIAGASYRYDRKSSELEKDLIWRR